MAGGVFQGFPMMGAPVAAQSAPVNNYESDLSSVTETELSSDEYESADFSSSDDDELSEKDLNQEWMPNPDLGMIR